MKSLEEALEALGKSAAEVVKSVRRYPNITWTGTSLVWRIQICPIAQYLRDATGRPYLVNVCQVIDQATRTSVGLAPPVQQAIQRLDATTLYVTLGESCPNPHWSPKAGTKERRGEALDARVESGAARHALPAGGAKVAPLEADALDLLEVG